MTIRLAGPSRKSHANWMKEQPMEAELMSWVWMAWAAPEP